MYMHANLRLGTITMESDGTKVVENADTKRMAVVYTGFSFGDVKEI